jgi:quercetin dioxygenase-like cupin family protein
MKRQISRWLIVVLTLITGWGISGGATAAALPPGQPLDLPCVTGVTVEHLGQAMPPDGNGLALVAARLTIAPDGGFAPHTHPGTLTIWVDSGTLDFTQIDDMEMNINRAPVEGTPATTEAVVPGQAFTLNPGDWLVEAPMVHQAWNHGTEPTVVILSGLVDPALPFVQCVEDATPAM